MASNEDIVRQARQKQNKHRENERNRTLRLNAGFNTLRRTLEHNNYVPARLSKAKLLRRATEYITALQMQLEEDDLRLANAQNAAAVGQQDGNKLLQFAEDDTEIECIEQNLSEQIEKFLRNEYTDVGDMRKYIPLLLKKAYSEHYQVGCVKLKGIWNSPPEGWPSEIDFLDPNNGAKNQDGTLGSKPRKEQLTLMWDHLMKKCILCDKRAVQPVDWNPRDEARLINEQLKAKLSQTGACVYYRLNRLQVYWASLDSSRYTEADVYSIHALNSVLSRHKMRQEGEPTGDLTAQLNIIADEAYKRLADLLPSVAPSPPSVGTTLTKDWLRWTSLPIVEPSPPGVGLTKSGVELQSTGDVSEMTSAWTLNPTIPYHAPANNLAIILEAAHHVNSA